MKTLGELTHYPLLAINAVIYGLFTIAFLAGLSLGEAESHSAHQEAAYNPVQTYRDGHWNWLEEIANQRQMNPEDLQNLYLGDIQSESWWSPHLTAEHIQATLVTSLRGPYKEHAVALSRHLIQLSKKYHFDPAVILAVIQAESTFRTDARSIVGAVGLMQLLPSTAQYIAEKSDVRQYRGAQDLVNPFMNLTLGVAYLAYLRKQFQQTEQYLAAYNMGPKAVREMLAKNEFYVGAGVEKYLTDIQGSVNSMRRQLADHSMIEWD